MPRSSNARSLDPAATSSINQVLLLLPFLNRAQTSSTILTEQKEARLPFLEWEWRASSRFRHKLLRQSSILLKGTMPCVKLSTKYMSCFGYTHRTTLATSGQKSQHQWPLQESEPLPESEYSSNGLFLFVFASSGGRSSSSSESASSSIWICAVSPFVPASEPSVGVDLKIAGLIKYKNVWIHQKTDLKYVSWQIK